MSQKRPVTQGATAGVEFTSPATADTVELSPIALFASKVFATPEMRHDKVAELKKLISSGKYETPQKIEKVVERFLKELE